LSRVYKCPKCGRFIDGTYSYCPYCGTPIKTGRSERSESGDAESVDYLHEQIAEFRHNEILSLAFAGVFIILALLFFATASLPVVRTEWRCIVTLYGQCIWYVPEFHVEQPLKTSGLILGILSMIAAIGCLAGASYYSYKRQKLIEKLKYRKEHKRELSW